MLILLSLLLQAGEPAARPGDAAELADALGIPLAEAEARMRIADRLGIFQLRAQGDADFAGAYLVHEPKVEAVVLFKGDAAAKLRRYGTEGAGFTARSVDHSLADLAAARDEARRLFKDARLAPVAMGLDIEANRVVAEFVDASAARRLKLPAAVVVETAEGDMALAPQKAGPVSEFPQARDPADVRMQALVTGALFVRGGCLRIGAEDGASHLVLWPSTARLVEADGKVTIDNGNNRLVVGTRVTLSGGESTAPPPPGWLVAPVAAACSGPYWIASDGW